jgi:hypothetical protein
LAPKLCVAADQDCEAVNLRQLNLFDDPLMPVHKEKQSADICPASDAEVSSAYQRVHTRRHVVMHQEAYFLS